MSNTNNPSLLQKANAELSTLDVTATIDDNYQKILIAQTFALMSIAESQEGIRKELEAINMHGIVTGVA